MQLITKPTAITLLSGGLDSATATAIALEKGNNVIGLSFNYGQRHKRELKAAQTLAKHFKLLEHHIIDINLSTWGGSSLTDLKQSIPHQGVQKGVIPNTYVPCRNTVFIAIGLSLAEAKQANQLVLGINAMDYSGYPDCRPDYLKQYQNLANLGSKTGREGKGTKLWAPLIHWNKLKIIQEAIRLSVPIEQTWSCYNGRDKECGVCDSCRIRNDALMKAGYLNL
ncbi:7-cyano-7-deazaguanine synthase QueC [Prochlorococcus marinus]|uniref:7-cyano-7-deazaguanine synthase QueC n=1 Tax=Prochlorococcus marinus TaxID=1219 RepID=UPI0022B4361F|nr:7-cyano-7-deazaguanine synthase QueC [Prochlorococcus marinus]